MSGKLWVIATPIGNLNDLSPRAREVLAQVELLACESKTAAQRLFSAVDIRLPRLVLYREDQYQDGQQRLLQACQEGLTCGLISDAGTPCISDPGWRLVNACLEREIPVLSLAGPSSLTAALAASGLPTRRFSFEGFPPHKKSDRKAFFAEIGRRTGTTVFFDSPHHVWEDLQILSECVEPQRRLSISRELTKIHEISQQKSMQQWLQEPPTARGELVLILEGAPPETTSETQDFSAPAACLREYGLSVSQTRDFLMKFFGVARNQAYQFALEAGQNA